MARRAAREEAAPVETPGPGKGRATPSRRQQEAARRQPIVVRDRKAARRASRTRDAEQRERARIGMANGEERYLLPRDRGPQRRFARDWIDSSWTLGELVVPVVIVFFVATLILPGAPWLIFGLYGFIVLAAVDGLLRATAIRHRLVARYGREHVQRGLNLYVILRSAQLRRMRTPKPQVGRGQKPA